MKKRTSLLAILLILCMLVLVVAGCERHQQTNNDEEDSEVSDVVNNDKDPDEDEDNSDKKDQVQSDDKLSASDYLTWVPTLKADGSDALFGYTNYKMEFAIKPKYKSAEPFYACGLAVVSEADYSKYGVINVKGEYVIQPEYEYITYTEGLFLASFNGITNAYDEKGNKVFTYDGWLGFFNEGYAISYGKGYIDKSGKLVLELPYEDFGPFTNGIARVWTEYAGPSFYIDKKGNDMTDKVSSGLRVVKDPDTNLYGYEDKDGKLVIDMKFLEAEPFLNGFAIVNNAADMSIPSYGIIDTNGDFAIGPNLVGISRMKNGVFLVGKTVDTEDYIPPQYFQYAEKTLYSKDLSKNSEVTYRTVSDYSEDIICASEGMQITFLDADLNLVKDLPELFGQGSVEADGDYLRGLINGRIVIYDKKGYQLMENNRLTLLGNGLFSTNSIYYPDFATELTSPLLQGLEDKDLEASINKTIQDELVIPWEESEGWDEYNFPVLYTGYSSYLIKNLYVVDQSIEEYYLGAAHPAHYRKVIFLDVTNGKTYAFADLFKNPIDASARLAEIVTSKLAQEDEDTMYFEDNVTPEQVQFFTLTDDSIIIYFGEYEIGPYAMGMPEFEIPFTDIMDFINTEGDFWKSFH